MNPVESSILLKKIRKANKPLNSWQTGLLISVEDRIKYGRYLSDLQSKALQKIYRKL